MEFGTETGDLKGSRGIKLSNDDTTMYIPFDPNFNTDYAPPAGLTGTYVGKGSVGLVSISADTGAAIWCNIYTYSETGTVKP
jgi:hypothetical protein